jgi:pyruvate dehydrogenase E1 component alpha subunit/2-oxoisovalerate dehydrogenase E1 component alpha subunit
VLPLPELDANAAPPELGPAEHHRLYRAMMRIRLLDEKLLLMQRQGRIAFFGPSGGQEAAIVGSGFVTQEQDWVFPALREGGVLLMRGFPLERYFGQLFGNSLDVQKGHQQPMHFSSGAHRFVSLSSVIATQLPQAVGASMAARIRGDDCVVFGYMGDGATSEHDFHCALNFAGVYRAPCVLICQNNQWAISVPFEKQTASPSIAIKARAYGIPGVGVDGNDVLAVVRATREARERARRGEGPTLLELVTYRRGGHSSSDDPGRYRDEDRVASWLRVDPIERYRSWLEREGLWNPARDQELTDALREEMETAIRKAESAPPPEPETIFEDVYATLPPHLQEQKDRGSLEEGGEVEGAFPL